MKDYATKEIMNQAEKALENLPDYKTDTTNAEKIVAMFGDKIRFDHRLRRWLIWRNHHWMPDSDGLINRKGILAARQQLKEAADVEDSYKRKKTVKWAMDSEGKIKLTAAIEIAKSILPAADDGKDWDLNNMLLGCSNGVLDLKTGKLRDGLPEDRITMQVGVAYDPKAKCPRWRQYINEIFEGNKELSHYVHKSLGYSITGETTEQAAFFCFGRGGNGKSVMFKTISGVLGDYAHTAPASLFQRNYWATNTNDIAGTEHKRFLVSSETLSTAKIHEERVKSWTGGDMQTARFLRKEFFSFEPTVKPWLFINHKPKVEDDTYAFWRRVRLIPFNRAFKGKEADEGLPKKLRKEFPGIFNWLIEGCLIWQKEGLQPTPEIVKLATREYRAENDELAEFIYADCVLDDEIKIKKSTLYTAYTNWAVREGYIGKDILTRNAFGRRMGDKFEDDRNMKERFYKGIALKSGKHDTLSNSPTSVNDTIDPSFVYKQAKDPRKELIYKTHPESVITSVSKNKNVSFLNRKRGKPAILKPITKEVLFDNGLET